MISMIIGYQAILHHLGLKINPVDFKVRRRTDATERRVKQAMEGIFPHSSSGKHNYFLLLLTHQRETFRKGC